MTQLNTGDDGETGSNNNKKDLYSLPAHLQKFNLNSKANDDTYNIDSKIPGFAMIFNNETFHYSTGNKFKIFPLFLDHDSLAIFAVTLTKTQQNFTLCCT